MLYGKETFGESSSPTGRVVTASAFVYFPPLGISHKFLILRESFPLFIFDADPMKAEKDRKLVDLFLKAAFPMGRWTIGALEISSNE